MIEDARQPRPRYGAWLLGIFFVLLGLPQVLGGAWLLALGGSPYYLPAGIALVAAGVLVFRGRAAGAWLYGAFFLVTILWSYYEVGLNGWGLLPRLFGLALLMILVLLLAPTLEPRVPS